MNHPARHVLQRFCDDYSVEQEVIAKFKALDCSKKGSLFLSSPSSSGGKKIVSLWQACCISSGVDFTHELATPHRINIGESHSLGAVAVRLRELTERYEIAQHAVNLDQLSAVGKSQRVLLADFMEWVDKQFSTQVDSGSLRLARYIDSHGPLTANKKTGGWAFKGIEEFARKEKERGEKGCDPKTIRKNLTDAMNARRGAKRQEASGSPFWPKVS